MAPLLEYVIKCMPVQESKSAMLRYGYSPAKSIANIENLDEEQQDKLNAT